MATLTAGQQLNMSTGLAVLDSEVTLENLIGVDTSSTGMVHEEWSISPYGTLIADLNVVFGGFDITTGELSASVGFTHLELDSGGMKWDLVDIPLNASVNGNYFSGNFSVSIPGAVTISFNIFSGPAGMIISEDPSFTNFAEFVFRQADSITGSSSGDSLLGYAGNDTIDGGMGSDSMAGGAGNDTYIVGQAGDVVTELGSQGTDTVKSSITYTLPTAVENLTLTGSGAINGFGNSGLNKIVGNGGANSLFGDAGNDNLNGGASGDALHGGNGNDTLTGSTGADKFYFDTLLNASSNKDVILDFGNGADKIILDNDIFVKLGAVNTTNHLKGLAAGQFSLDGVAHDTSDYIIYDPTNGTLTYDTNGSTPLGNPTVFAVLWTNAQMTTHPELAYTNFQVYQD